MTDWSESQRVRLAYEERLLGKEFSHFSLYDRAKGGLTTVRGEHITSANRAYGLCIWISIGYPHQMPNLYVTSPSPLLDSGGKPITGYKTSHLMHVWESDWNNYVKICHCKDAFWSASMTLVNV